MFNIKNDGKEFWGCGAIILNNKEEILIGIRSDTNEYELIGGKIEIGETPLEGIKREIKEETGLTVKKIKYFGYYEDNFTKDGQMKFGKDFTFVCYEFEGELIPQPKEVNELMWVSVDKVKELKPMFLPSAKAIEFIANQCKLDNIGEH